MSYCRWSDDGYRSDVYVYSEGGEDVVIHVVGGRYRLAPPSAWRALKLRTTWYGRALVAVWRWASRVAGSVPLESPVAGATYRVRGWHRAVTKLHELRQRGVRVPSHAIDGLLDEVDAKIKSSIREHDVRIELVDKLIEDVDRLIEDADAKGGDERG